MIRFQMAGFFFIVLFTISFADAQSKYPETIAALQIGYRNEMQAHFNYMAYAYKAKAENYPNMSHLFVSFAASEFIHARNFKRILFDLGVEAKELPKSEVKVSSTKANLKDGIDFEIADIDQRYPQLLERMKPEGHEAAIRFMTYAWETEKQHRDILQKMQSGTGIFFGQLAKRIEETSLQYFVCLECGSTYIELPRSIFPICKVSISQFKEVEGIK